MIMILFVISLLKQLSVITADVESEYIQSMAGELVYTIYGK